MGTLSEGSGTASTGSPTATKGMQSAPSDDHKHGCLRFWNDLTFVPDQCSPVEPLIPAIQNRAVSED